MFLGHAKEVERNLVLSTHYLGQDSKSSVCCHGTTQRGATAGYICDFCYGDAEETGGDGISVALKGEATETQIGCVFHFFHDAVVEVHLARSNLDGIRGIFHVLRATVR